MRSARFVVSVLGLLVCLGSARAQDADPASPAVEAEPAPKAKPRPKPKPKPVSKPDTTSVTPPALPTEPPAEPAQTTKSGGDPDPGAAAAAMELASPMTSQTAPTVSPVACDPGKSVFYDAPAGFAFWVTRTGSVTVENPLRPLTPETTRVLQLVISGKLATAYGAELDALRRGGSPGVLEAQLGAPIRWDASLGTLPDTLGIVSDSGASLAQMRFKECGDAPAAKTLPIAGKKGGKTAGSGASAGAVANPEQSKPGQSKPARKPPVTTDRGPSPPAAGLARPVQPRAVPQGAIQE